MKCKRAVKRIKAHGWFLKRVKGSHYHFEHPSVDGLLTLPFHASKELSPYVWRSIMKKLDSSN